MHYSKFLWLQNHIVWITDAIATTKCQKWNICWVCANLNEFFGKKQQFEFVDINYNTICTIVNVPKNKLQIQINHEFVNHSIFATNFLRNSCLDKIWAMHWKKTNTTAIQTVTTNIRQIQCQCNIYTSITNHWVFPLDSPSRPI